MDDFNDEHPIYTDHLLPIPRPIVNDDTAQHIETFKNRPDVTEVLKEKHYDEYLLRWLIACEMDQEKAASMFVASMHWREENRIDEILEWFPLTECYERLTGYWPISRTGEEMTVDGWPVFYERVGVVDPRDVFEKVEEQDLINFHVYESERRERLRDEMYHERGFSVGTTFVQDLSELSMKSLYPPGIGIVSKLSAIDKANYPESVRKVYIINVPTLFSLVWKTIKGFFEPGLVRKFSIMSGNGYDAISRIVPEGHVPDFAGGSKENCAPGGVGYNWYGTDAIVVPSSKSHRVSIEMEEGDDVDWFLFTSGKDIRLQLGYEDDILEDFGRLQKHEISYTAERSGVHHLIFDNTFSWTTKKTVHYNYTIKKIQ
eukprot:TRINITY_DN5708_c0_g1_i1.p1 TRINITY_DN5708_c0_g1~~TRINITY_DN5708_c0_g1_i1.p1  ORF type:complete len:373 (-),score=62.48 TRINITY_DN5708_c0_g1_i1:37-1155(-)